MIAIYITDLSAYNEGNLIGKWVQLPINKKQLSQLICEVLSEGEIVSESYGHEEVFISDYEAPISIAEYDDIYRLNELARAMEEYDEDDLLKLKFLISEGYDERAVIGKGLDSYDVVIYDYRDDNSFTDTFELLAQDFVEEGLFGEVPEVLESYIDNERIARDLRMDYYEFEPNVIGRVA